VAVVAAPDETKEPVENDELHFELDAVHNRLVRCLDREVAGVLSDKEADIEDNGENVDDDEVSDNSPLLRCLYSENWPEGTNSLNDVEHRYETLLDAEPCELNALVDFKDFDEACRVATVAAEEDDGDGDVKDAEAGDYHY